MGHDGPIYCCNVCIMEKFYQILDYERFLEQYKSECEPRIMEALSLDQEPYRFFPEQLFDFFRKMRMWDALVEIAEKSQGHAKKEIKRRLTSFKKALADLDPAIRCLVYSQISTDDFRDSHVEKLAASFAFDQPIKVDGPLSLEAAVNQAVLAERVDEVLEVLSRACDQSKSKIPESSKRGSGYPTMRAKFFIRGGSLLYLVLSRSKGCDVNLKDLKLWIEQLAGFMDDPEYAKDKWKIAYLLTQHIGCNQDEQEMWLEKEAVRVFRQIELFEEVEPPPPLMVKPYEKEQGFGVETNIKTPPTLNTTSKYVTVTFERPDLNPKLFDIFSEEFMTEVMDSRKES